MKLKLTPLMLAKMATFKRDLVLREQEMLKAAEPDVAKVAEVEPGPEAEPQYHAMKAAEAAVYKRDIDTATRRRLASRGPRTAEPVLPDRERGRPRERGHAGPRPVTATSVRPRA